jgi:MFS family permease
MARQVEKSRRGVAASPTVEANSDARHPRSRDSLWNFLTLGGDIAFFTLALNIASTYTIYPLFAVHLGADNTIIALIPAIRALGVYAPQLLIAPRVERLRRVKPMILALTVGERVPILIMGIVALTLASSQREWTLAIFLLMTLIPSLSSGLTFPGWYDMIGRAIPRDWIGRFLGIWLGVGGVLGALGSIAATALIASYTFPLNFALCFLVSFVAYVLSFALLAMGREPARIVTELPNVSDKVHSDTTRTGFAAQLAILRADGAFSRYLIANAIAGVATMASAVFAVAAAKEGGLSDPEVGAEGVVLIVAMTLGNFLWGFIGDHFGHRAPLIWGSVGAGASAALALVAHGIWWYSAAFCLLGISISATQLTQLTATGEFGPPQRRASYIAIFSIAYAPLAVGAPLLGGWMADRWGYGVVFGMSALFGLFAAAAFALWGPPAPSARARRPNTPVEASRQ